MTQGMCRSLGIPSLDDILKKNVESKPESLEPGDHERIEQSLAALRQASSQVATLEGTDHAEAMDVLYTEIVQHARDLMAYGFNIDMPRQRGIFEIAAIMYGHAMSAKNSKRDAQLKALRLALDSKKVDSRPQAATVDDDGTIVVEDRNELIRKIREQIKSQPPRAET